MRAAIDPVSPDGQADMIITRIENELGGNAGLRNASPIRWPSLVVSEANPSGRTLKSVSNMDVTASLILDHQGLIGDCNPMGEVLFKYHRDEMAGRHISMLLPQLAEFELVQQGQPNALLRYLCRLGSRFQAIKRDGGHFASELFLNILDNAGQEYLSLIVRPAS